MTAPAESGELADTVLRASASLIEDQGEQALTMRAVAARAGYSPTAIYLAYKNKQELLDATAARMRDLLVEELLGVQIGDDLALHLERIGVRFVRWGVEHPNGYRLLFEHREGRPAFTTVAALQGEVWSGERDVTAQVYANELARYPDPAGIVDLAWATLHGIVWLAISGQLTGPGSSEPMTDIDTSKERATGLAATFARLILGAPPSRPADQSTAR